MITKLQQLEIFIESLTNERVVNDLRRRSFIGIFFVVFIGLTIYFTYDFNTRHPELVFSFLGPLITVCSLRILHLIFFSSLARYFPLGNSLVFFCSVLLTALIWGYGFSSIMVLDGEYPTQILMTIVSAGICSGGVVAYIPNRFLSFAYNAGIMWPVAIYMCLTIKFRTAGVLFLLYSAYLAIQTVKGNQEYWVAINNEEKLRRQSQELAVLSRVDVLTGLFNRRYFEELFEQEWNKAIRNGSPISLLVCDLDNFKMINDRYGHLAGDEILRGTAENLITIFKRVTDIICRYGGEEFVVLLSIDLAKAKNLAEHMCHLQEQEKFRYQQQLIQTTISIGLASIVPSHQDNRDDFFLQADNALYCAKKSGKNKVAII